MKEAFREKAKPEELPVASDLGIVAAGVVAT